MPKEHWLAAVQRAAALTDSCVVGVSCGKDSLAALDLCAQHFRRVEAFYLYTTPGLSFHEECLARLERRYKITIMRLPHWGLSEMLRHGVFRDPSAGDGSIPRVTIRDIENRVRELTGIEWIAGGMKKCDSLERRGMLSACNAVDEKARRFHPLAEWSHAFVFNYLKRRKIGLPADYRMLGQSYGGDLDASSLRAVREHFPADYERIRTRFPHIEAEMLRADWHSNAGDS